MIPFPNYLKLRPNSQHSWLFTFSLLIIGFHTPLCGQENFSPGKVITLQGDTLYGQISEFGGLGDNVDRCIFRQDGAGQEQIFNPGDIQGYLIDNRRFFEQMPSPDPEANGAPVFVEWLIKGAHGIFKIRRFYYYFDQQTGKPELIPFSGVEYSMSAFAHFELREWYSFLNRLGLKCPQVSEFLNVPKNTRQSVRKIEQIVEMLNTCQNEPYIKFGADGPAFRANLGLSLDFSHSKVQFFSDYPEFFPFLVAAPFRNTYPGIGISMMENSIRRKSPFSFNISLMGRPMRIKKNFRQARWLDLALSTGVRYTLPLAIKPRIGIQVDPTLHMQLASKVRGQFVAIPGETTSGFDITRFQPGIGIQANLLSRLSNSPERWELALGLRHGTGISLFDGVSLDKKSPYNSTVNTYFIKTTWWWR